MNSLIRVLMERQDARTHSGIRNVVSSTSGKLTPSTPRL